MQAPITSAITPAITPTQPSLPATSVTTTSWPATALSAATLAPATPLVSKTKCAHHVHVHN